jgi:hypothetical protein
MRHFQNGSINTATFNALRHGCGLAILGPPAPLNHRDARFAFVVRGPVDSPP